MKNLISMKMEWNCSTCLYGTSKTKIKEEIKNEVKTEIKEEIIAEVEANVEKKVENSDEIKDDFKAIFDDEADIDFSDDVQCASMFDKLKY